MAWPPGTSRLRRISSRSARPPTGSAWRGCAHASATAACPTCAGRLRISRCTSSPTLIGRRAARAPRRYRRTSSAASAARKGRGKSAPSTPHACLYPRGGRVDAHGQFTIVRQATRAVYPDPYLVTHSLGDWTARLDTLEARDEPCPDEGAQACLGAARREV